ncbi:hypothetical protein [Sulfitobacter sp. R18_1]|uniref:hypothetical protein n=1 Tax=Sulfitobacter sp. R18_1 TaxID=2821104 RepID=UPI001ADD12A4|nr:hypothetical protein [Sulfitobacter sp. R18_1]MBO9430627.1 hypothetical protein [Sulfitobacter sp. R18_1]
MAQPDTIPTRPAFDTPEWRDIRDGKLREWVGNDQAVGFLLQFFDLCEVIDDLWDGDKEVTKADLTRILFAVMTELPLNPFFANYRNELAAVMITGINAWLDANELEQGSENDKVFSYVLRDWYAELIAFVIYLTRGRDYMRAVSMEVRHFFTHHETLEQYREDLA